jgi:hypothetical protein
VPGSCPITDDEGMKIGWLAGWLAMRQNRLDNYIYNV